MLPMPRIVRPDPQRSRSRNLVSPLDRQLADHLANKEPPKHLVEANHSQARGVVLERACQFTSAQSRVTPDKQ